MRDRRPTSLGEALHRHNVRLNTANQVLQVVGVNMVNPFLGILALKLGASSVEVGLLAALPAAAAAAVALPAAAWLGRVRERQRVTAGLFLAARAFYLVLASIPLWAGPAAPLAVAAAAGLMSLPGSAAMVAWQSFVARVFPFGRRGAAFATSNRWMAVATTTTVLASGAVIDRLGSPRGYEVAFTLAFAVGLFEVAAFRRLIPPRRERVPEAARVPLAAVWRHTPLRRFLLFSLLWYLAWQMPWPLFTQYQVSVLGADNLWLGILSVTNNLAVAAAYAWWARRADRHGNLASLGLACIGLASAPLSYALAHRLWQLAVLNAVTGLAAAGVTLLLFNSLLEVVPAGTRTTALALYNGCVNAMAAVAPMLGVALLARVGYAPSFLAATVLRLLAGLAFLRLAAAAAPPAPRAATA
jgi:MFS family permease